MSNSDPLPTHEAHEQDLCENLLLETDNSEQRSVVGPEEDDLTRVASLRVIDEEEEENDVSKSGDYALYVIRGGLYPPTLSASPPKPSATNFMSRSRIGSSRRANVWPVVSTRTSPT